MATEIRIAKRYMKIKPKCEIGKIWQIKMNTALHDINLTKFGLTNYQMYIDLELRGVVVGAQARLAG